MFGIRISTKNLSLEVVFAIGLGGAKMAVSRASGSGF